MEDSLGNSATEFSPPPRLGLFGGYGVELEYMIVDAETLDVKPIADAALSTAAGTPVSEMEFGAISWSNELALHVLEFKTTGPARDLAPLPSLFLDEVRRANEILRSRGAMLAPTAMHPWMNPEQELKLWPHEFNAVYEAFQRIFDCRGHGWANLQSAHLNLPFADAEEFGRLHAAIRLILPLIPALAASSPIVDGRSTGILDNRLEFYRNNSRRVPQAAAQVIPEAVFTPEAYQAEILAPLYAAIRPLDRDDVLQQEWLNARGAIARFDRSAIEIRLIDVQECPTADLAVVAAVAGAVQALVREDWSTYAAQCTVATDELAEMLLAGIRDADQAMVASRPLLNALGFEEAALPAGRIWSELIHRIIPRESPWRDPLELILSAGPLARRIEKAVGRVSIDRLRKAYADLAKCLNENQMFRPDCMETP